MAAPATITMKNLSGKYTMNKSLSESQDSFLSLQGIGWVTRKAIGLATVTLNIKEYEEAGFLHVDITSTASGLSSTQEDRTLNWEEGTHKDQLFGNVKGKSRLIKKAEYEPSVEGVTDAERQFLLGDKLKDGSPSTFLDDELIQSLAVGQDSVKWSVEQIWGFEEVQGARRYTRRLICKKGGKTELLRLVYDFNGA